MPAIIRAYGTHFDVDAYLKDCALPVCAVKRRNDLVFPVSGPDGRRHEQSGVHVVVSDAGFDDFPRQVAEATAFLTTHERELRRLSAFPGVEPMVLDFGIARRDVPIQCDRLPSDLLQLAGALAIDIELSQYPPAEPDARSGE